MTQEQTPTAAQLMLKQMQMLSEMTEELQKEEYSVTGKTNSIKELTKAMVRLAMELRIEQRPSPYLSPVEVLEKSEDGLRFGFSDRQPAGIAAQLTDKEQERIGPEALQRMADVFNGPEAER